MTNKINAKFGVLEDRVIHLATDEEIQMVKNLIQDITQIQSESKNSSYFGWATTFIGASFSSVLTLLGLSGNSQNLYLVYSLIFITFILGIFFYWNWYANRKREQSMIQLKEKQLQDLFRKIEQRVKKSNQYDQIIISD